MKGNQLMKYLFVLIAGAINPLAFSPFGFWYVLLPSFATLFLCWRTTNKKQAFLLGLVFGLGQFGVGVSWVYVSIQTFGGMPPILAGVCVFVFVLILALFPALAGWAQGLFNQRRFAVRMVLIMPMMFLLFEWIRGWIFSGLPWLTTGYAMLPTHLSGLAPLGGVYLVSLVTLLLVGAIIVFIDTVNLKTITLVAMLSLVWLGGWVMNKSSGSDHGPWTRVVGEPISIAIIQNNIPLEDKWDISQHEVIIGDYLSLSEQHRDKDLIIWPEGAVPSFIEQLPQNFWDYLKQHPADFAFGALHQPVGQSRYYNSMVGVSDETMLYNKQHLVPFGEFFPMQTILSPALNYLSIPMSDFSSWDTTQAPLQLAGVGVAASICYEDAFPNESRNQVPTSGLLLNISEDMWFGDSFAPHQRLQMAQFRSRESERPMIRSSNNGLSSIIAWDGSISTIAPQFKKAVVEGLIQPRSGVTPYVRYGNLPALILMAGLLLFGLLFGRRSLR